MSHDIYTALLVCSSKSYSFGPEGTIVILLAPHSMLYVFLSSSSLLMLTTTHSCKLLAPRSLLCEYSSDGGNDRQWNNHTVTKRASTKLQHLFKNDVLLCGLVFSGPKKLCDGFRFAVQITLLKVPPRQQVPPLSLSYRVLTQLRKLVHLQFCFKKLSSPTQVV